MGRKTLEIEGQLDFFDFLFAEENKTEIKDMSQFAECDECWCKTCKHNSRNEGVPRDMLGQMKACPACDKCIAEDEPNICVINDAKRGCSLRAKEEGIGE